MIYYCLCVIFMLSSLLSTVVALLSVLTSTTNSRKAFGAFAFDFDFAEKALQNIDLCRRVTLSSRRFHTVTRNYLWNSRMINDYLLKAERSSCCHHYRLPSKSRQTALEKARYCIVFIFVQIIWTSPILFSNRLLLL